MFSVLTFMFFTQGFNILQYFKYNRWKVPFSMKVFSSTVLALNWRHTISYLYIYATATRYWKLAIGGRHTSPSFIYRQEKTSIILHLNFKTSSKSFSISSEAVIRIFKNITEIEKCREVITKEIILMYNCLDASDKIFSGRMHYSFYSLKSWKHTHKQTWKEGKQYTY